MLDRSLFIALVVASGSATLGCTLPRTITASDPDAAGEERDGGIDARTPLDADPPVDAFVPEPDAFVPGADAFMLDGGPMDLDAPPTADAFVLGPDAFIATDAFVSGADAYVAPIDAYVAPIDAYVAPVDAYVAPIDAYVDDAYVAPVDAGCTTGTTRCASATMLETCRVATWVAAPCALGCSSTGGAHCAALVPSNLDDTVPFVDGGMVTISSNQTWNTAMCSTLPGMPMRVTQTGGGDACVVRVGTLRVEATRVLSVVGPIPLIVLALHEILIEGTLDVSAYGATPGPGGGAGSTFTYYASGSSPGLDGFSAPNNDGGGGGGGLSGAGGQGGRGGSSAGGFGGGALSVTLSPLIGGSGGGVGGSGESQGLGGAGGGAVQLTAIDRVRIQGTLLAGGGGGRGGLDGTSGDSNIGAGGGGGSGGGVLLESTVIEAPGIIRASGGGGGGAAGCFGRGDAGAGADGAAAAGRALGGVAGRSCMSGTTYGAAGGVGGADATLAGAVGPANTAGNANGGGGGGAAGTIVLRTPSGAVPGGGTRSPSIAPGIQGLPLVIR